MRVSELFQIAFLHFCVPLIIRFVSFCKYWAGEKHDVRHLNREKSVIFKGVNGQKHVFVT